MELTIKLTESQQRIYDEYTAHIAGGMMPGHQVFLRVAGQEFEVGVVRQRVSDAKLVRQMLAVAIDRIVQEVSGD